MGTFLFSSFPGCSTAPGLQKKENRNVPYSFLTGLLRHGDTAVQ
jgi:hypothetical protein